VAIAFSRVSLPVLLELTAPRQPEDWRLWTSVAGCPPAR